MTEQQLAWKTYYITCFLLANFKGIHSMLAEKELFDEIYSYLKGEQKRKDLIEYTDMTFGLSSYYLTKALQGFKEEEDFFHGIYGDEL